MLKISVLDINLGGYPAYWQDEVYVNIGNYMITLVGHSLWVKQ